MNEDFAPFELAVKLKEKGFREECFARYSCYNEGYFERNSYHPATESVFHCYNNDEDLGRFYADAPTISQVLKWFRKKYSIHISTKPHPCEDGIMWLYEIRKFNKCRSVVVANKTGFIKEEQANIAGIKCVLDNLI